MNQRPDSTRDAGIVIHSSVIPLGRMDRVKNLLRTREELCSMSDLYGNTLSNGRNDISTLCLKRGWVIKKWWTRHDGEAHVHYQLVKEGEIKPKQRALFA